MVRALFFLVIISGNLLARQPGEIIDDKDFLYSANYLGDFLLAIKNAESALALAESAQDKHRIAFACYDLGKLYGTRISDFKKGIYYHEKSATIAKELHENKLVANNYLISGMLYYHLGLYGKGLEQLLTSYNIYNEQQDLLNSSFAKVGIAAIYSEQDGAYYAKAKVNFYDAIKTAKTMKNDSLLVMAISYYTTALISHNQFDEAEKYLNKAVKLAKSNKNYALFIPVLFSNLGDLFFHSGMLKAAVNYFEMAHEHCVKNKIMPGLALSSMKLGKVYFKLGEIEQAVHFYFEALQGFKILGMQSKLLDVCDGLAILNYNQQKFKEAFYYRSLQSALTDSIYKSQNDLLFEVESRVLKSKIAIAQKNEGINWLALSLIFLVLLLSFFMMLLYFNHRRLREAKSRSMLVNENVILEKELQNQKLHEETLLRQLEFNAKTLTTNTLHIIQKNEILLQVKEKAEILRTSFPENLLPIKVKDLLHLVNFGLNIDKDWDNFKIHFEQVHTDFFDHLKAKYPHLNSSDLKLCALLKLNLDTKEIAAIMNISPPSVKVARSRLRKKLELDLASNLSSFITQI